MPPELISNLAQELTASRNLLSALAGPSIALTVDVQGGALPVRLKERGFSLFNILSLMLCRLMLPRLTQSRLN